MFGSRAFWSRSSSRRGRRATIRRHWETLERRLLLAGDMVAFWLADDLATDPADAGPIVSWLDQVAGIPAVASGTPQLVADASGRRVVQLDPRDGADFFEIDQLQNPVTRADDFSVVVGFRTASTSLVGSNGPWYENTGLVDANLQGFGADWGLTINGSGRLSTGLGGGFGAPSVSVDSSADGLNDGQWHVASVIRSGSSLTLSVDGHEAVSRDDVPALSRATLPLVFGDLATGSAPFEGDLAQIRFYNGPLSATEVGLVEQEILAYYNNSPPLAVRDAYSSSEDRPLVVDASAGVLSNDTDADGDVLTAKLLELPQHGTLAFAADGSFEYSPAADFQGVDSFTYVAVDFRESEPVTVTLMVQSEYDPPRPTDDRYTLRPDETLSMVAADGVLANDGNPDQAVLRALLVQDVSEGQLDLRADGGFDYLPNGFAGVTMFRYRIDDQTSLTAPVTVTLIVNTQPESREDTYELLEDTALIVNAAGGVTANDLDPESDPLVAELVSAPMHGTVQLEPNGSFQYLPGANFFGTDRFTYRVRDAHAASAPAAVTLNIRAVNDAPDSAEDVYYAAKEEWLDVATDDGLLRNDSDREQNPITVSLVTAAEHGTVELAPDGSFRYLAEVGFAGTDSFSYRAEDGLDSSPATSVSIHVLHEPVLINEFLASNATGITTRTRYTPEEEFNRKLLAFDWIELRNLSSGDLDLGGFHLTDDADDPTRWRIPEGTILPARGYLLVFASGYDIQDPQLDSGATLHTDFRLSSEGEYLAITDRAGRVVHDYGPEYPRQGADVAYGLDHGLSRHLPTPTPLGPNAQSVRGIVADVRLSHERGFYEAPFELAMEVAEPDATVRYTLDGTEPSADQGTLYTEPLTIDRTTTVRAIAVKPGFLPSTVRTWTYFYLDDILRQSPDGVAPPGWPTENARINGQSFDYGMDPDVVDSPDWGPQMRAALTQIPSLSIVTDLQHLFNPEAGIYVNAARDGIAWERPMSVELLHPDGQVGFQVNAGVRMRGGFSRTGANPKHSFRLFFRSELGDAELRYPLFGAEGVEQFQQIDLRTAQNNSWNNGGSTAVRNVILRDIFSRDTQREMGQPYKRGRYYHLYLNGQYWGVYQTDERAEADYAQSYFGGREEDYDVQNAEATTDGTNRKWVETWSLVRNGFASDNVGYYAIQGLNPDGTANSVLERFVDVDNVIDYMILIYYTGNGDAPVTPTGLNNFFAIRNRHEPDGWKFLAHDSETSMLSLNVNNTGETQVRDNPKWLHQQLMTHPDYRMRFADRVHQHFANDGVLTPQRVADRLQRRADEFDQAMIAESARWGDLTRRLFTQEDWQREVDWLTQEFAPQRTDIALGQLIDAGQFPATAPPQFSQHGGNVPTGFQLTIDAPSGTIYYSLDGRDPRLPGGAVNDAALVYLPASGVVLNQTSQVMARVLDGDQWSALTAAEFGVGLLGDPSALRISEVHYHPRSPSPVEVAAGFNDGDDFEFLEIVNPTETAIDLTGVRLVQTGQADGPVGVDFEFAAGWITRLEAGFRLIVAEDAEAFRLRYGDRLPLAGQWQGGLSNAGETLTLQVGDTIIQQFTYDDVWHPLTDGPGYSLETVDPSHPNLQRWSTPEGWQVSVRLGGTPGAPGFQPGDANQDGRFDTTDLLMALQAGEYEDSLENNSTFFEGDWDGDGDFTTSDLVLAFKLGSLQPAAAGLREPRAAVTQMSLSESMLTTLAKGSLHAALDPLPRPNRKR